MNEKQFVEREHTDGFKTFILVLITDEKED